MRPTQTRWLLPATLLTLMSAASAQMPVPAADPLEPQAKVPPVAHASSLAQFRRMTDEKVGSWREANDNVGRIGGWRTYAREARQPEPATAPASSPNPNSAAEPAKPAAMPAGQGGHKMN